jgi:2-amino-4-hydroxy-6-hydroxymethyldihydropteridine diphosphokinase
MAETVYLLLGSNLGDRKQFLDIALERLESFEGLEIIATSPVYVSEAQEVTERQPSYLNQVIKGEYRYASGELLTGIERIETELGRTDKGTKLPRTIDIDILLFGDQEIKTEKLTVPHPGLLRRAFAMVPLLDIDRDIIHPVAGQPVADFLKDSDREHIIRYEDHVARNV